ncbi:MAG: hypothetical protein OEY59_01005 [Deltaproteobacteria bacterium]|nr:hypothetical protein [Deltaproteobacteria bacterium]
MMGAIFSRAEALMALTRAKAFKGEIRRSQKGLYDSETGKFSSLKLGFYCRVLPLSQNASENNLFEIKELYGGEKKVLVAIEDRKITYGANWEQLSTSTETPFVPRKEDWLYYNSILFRVLACFSQDMESGVLYELVLAG